MFCYYVSSMLFPKPFLPGIACNMAAVSRLCSRHVLKPVNGDILFCLAFPSLLSVIITFGLIKHTAHNSALFACIIMEPEFCLYSCIIMEPSSELERLRSVYPTLRWRRGRFMHFSYHLSSLFWSVSSCHQCTQAKWAVTCVSEKWHLFLCSVLAQFHFVLSYR